MQNTINNLSTSYKLQATPSTKGATLIDTIVATALMLVVFVGIAAAFRLSIDVITNNKARAGAIALANERMEYIRSLPYDQVAVLGGIPAGTLLSSEDVELNGITYTRRTVVLWADDPKDGSGALDENSIITDYKEVKTEVSWTLRFGTRQVSLTTRVSPTGLETAVAGGVLDLSIVNATGQVVPDALISIVNTTLNPNINLSLYSDDTGKVTVVGAPVGAGYQINVSKSGYNNAQTYDATVENTNPTPGHLTIANNQTTSATYAIDVVATKRIQTFSPVQQSLWTDTFADFSNVAASTDIYVISGTAQLATSEGAYVPVGTLRSEAIVPTDLAGWGSFLWIDSRPAQTTILFRVYNGDGSELVPDSQVPGNAAGLSSSPVTLTGVSTTTYPSLSVHATLGTADSAATPELDSWSVSYDQGPIPLPNITFALQGTKIVGSGPSGFIYKYSNSTLSSGGTASVDIQNLEWDTYTISVNGANGYDISSICAPQPEALSPGALLTTNVTLSPHTTHSFLVDVRSSAGTIIPNASVRLYRGVYDTTKTTDSCGQTFYSSLSQGTPGGGNPYSIDVSATGYQSFSTTDVSVSGTSRLSVVLNSL